MKRGTPDHPKVQDLMHLLRIKKPTALGYLELLWHFTAKYAPQGNIGKYSDARIEAALDWHGRPASLLQALCTSKFVTSSRAHRLVVHDWHEHCDNAVKKQLQRANLPFLSIQEDSEKVSRQCLERGTKTAACLALPSHSHSPTATDVADAGQTHGANERGKEKKETSPEALKWFEEEFWPIVWAKIAVGEARRAWLRQVKTRELAEKLIREAGRQGPGILRRGRRPGSSILHPATWINQERWNDESGEPDDSPPQREIDMGEAMDAYTKPRAAE